jgi:NAD-dependent DNA ligase
VKAKRVTPVVSVFLASALPLAAAALAHDPARRQDSPPPRQSQTQDQSPNKEQSEVKTFAGKITKSNSRYVLEDPSANSPYYLDDAKSAKKYEGKNVVVTGTLDAANRTIHVQKIESAA